MADIALVKAQNQFLVTYDQIWGQTYQSIGLLAPILQNI